MRDSGAQLAQAEDGRAKSHTLTREDYIGEATFERKYHRLFSAGWVFAGHASQLVNQGDYFRITLAGEEFLVVRGQHGAIHAHFNVCRHRGHRLCHDDAGRVPFFLCGYHQWRFALDGNLVKVPQSADRENFSYCQYKLKSARAECWNGLVFIHLGTGDIRPLATELAEFEGVGQQFDPARTRLADQEVHEISGNWKIAVDNAMECYHCTATHRRSLARVVDVTRLVADLGDWIPTDTSGRDGNLGSGGMHVRPGFQTMSADGQLICEKLLGRCTTGDAENTVTDGMIVLPNFFYAAFYVDHWWTIAIRPQSAAKTQLIYAWYVRDDATQGTDYDVERLIEVGQKTQLEDNVLIERTHAGVMSRHFSPGPLGPKTEAGIIAFNAYYRARMCDERKDCILS